MQFIPQSSLNVLRKETEIAHSNKKKSLINPPTHFLNYASKRKGEHNAQ